MNSMNRLSYYCDGIRRPLCCEDAAAIGVELCSVGGGRGRLDVTASVVVYGRVAIGIL